jgi:predicted transposase YdaD
VYFDLGEGDDYVYHGTTVFMGLHSSSELKLNAKQQQLYNTNCISDLYPEYYIIKVGKFNDVALDTLDEWIYYLKNNQIKDDFTAQGIDIARILLAIEKLTAEEKLEHDRMVEENRNRESEIVTAFSDGEIKGKAIGLEEGKAIGLEEGKAIGRTAEKEQVVINSHHAGLSVEAISNITELTIEQIFEILKRHGLICRKDGVLIVPTGSLKP